MRRIRWIRLASRRSLTGSTNRAIQLQLPALNPYIPDDFTLIKSDKAGRIRS